LTFGGPRATFHFLNNPLLCFAVRGRPRLSEFNSNSGLCVPDSGFTASIETWQVPAQEKPKVSGAGAHEKHNDNVVFQAGGKKGMSVIGTNRTHEETQAGKKSRQQSIGRRAISNSFPNQTDKVR